MTTDTKAIRAQMEELAGFTAGPWVYYADLPSVEPNWHIVTTDNKMRVLANVHIEPGNAMDVANTRLIAAAPDMRETILTLCDRVDKLNAAIVRQAGAAKTLREATLASVQRLRDIDRSEYFATTSLDGERKANEVLTDENDKLRAENERLRSALRPFVTYVHDDYRRGKATYELVATDRAGGGLIGAEDLRRARAALAQKGGE